MKRTCCAIVLVLLATAGLRAEPGTPAAPPAPDPSAQAIAILQGSYADFAGLHYRPGESLGDLVARSNGRISVLSPELDAPAPILTAALPDGVAYWRLATFTPRKDWPALAADLKSMIDTQHVSGAVLDLRDNVSPDDYAGAAQVLAFFAPGDASLAAKGAPASVTPPRLDGPVIVLTNGLTAGAAEALAARLKTDGALIIGRTTAGTAFAQRKLSNGETLRFAIAAAPAPSDGIVRPVEPDIALTVDDHNEKAALSLIRDSHVLDVIQESAPRHRMSEASLVNGQDPEWDDYLATLEKGPVLLSLPHIHDPVLTTALDSLRAIHLSERSAPVQAAADASHPAGVSLQ